MRLGMTLLTALMGACAGHFDPDIDGGTEGGTFMLDSDDGGHSSTTGNTTSSSADSASGSASTTGASTSNPTSGSTDSEASGSSEGSTGEVLEGCGNNIIEDDEECDGVALGGQTCASVLGMGSGNLGCSDDCTLNVTSCSLDGDQPADGQWSECQDYPDCESDPPDGIIWHCENYLCSFDCQTDNDCGPSPGGTATTECRPLSPEHPEQGARCYLNCSEGKTCPSGMACGSGIYCQSLFE